MKLAFLEVLVPLQSKKHLYINNPLPSPAPGTLLLHATVGICITLIREIGGRVKFPVLPPDYTSDLVDAFELKEKKTSGDLITVWVFSTALPTMMKEK